MLAYAFSILTKGNYRNIAVEKFDNAIELCAAILEHGIESLVKSGLGREYVDRTDVLSSLRGKVEISETLKSQSFLRRQIVCFYDEFSIDSQMNRIIKATIDALVRSNISKTRKKKLKRLMVYFSNVEMIDLRFVNWRMRYDRNNQNYCLLMAVCQLVAKGLLQTQDDGKIRMKDFFDEQRMCRLYEKFVLEYYRKEHPEVVTNANYINWALDDDFSDALPAMKSDIMLSLGNRVLIIDAKYYDTTMQQNFDKRSIHSGNLYQIFTYVKNKDAELANVAHKVSGLLLYAKTDEDNQPDGTYQMSGNQISVKTLDLNCDFAVIREQLDSILDLL